jgi:inhibitor of cysteine peptidase
MVQQEVSKKTRVYGTAAALSAIVLVSLIFVFGSAPSLTPNLPDNTPSTVTTAMKTFGSYEDLKNYILTNTQGTGGIYKGGPLDAQFFGERSGGMEALSPAPSFALSTDSQNAYSTTNIQVAGVDEADTVKTDGIYIYTASNDYSTGQNLVFILKADPQDPRVIAKIALDNNTYLAGMFLSQDSNKLVIIGSQYQLYALDVMPSDAKALIYPYRSEVRTFMSVYDISDKVHPTLAKNFTLTGSYFNSRMIGDYVYAVVSQSAYVNENAVPLPTVYTATGAAEIPATKIFYADAADYTNVESNYFTFTSFYGLNLKDTGQDLTNMTVLMGGASTMYVSLGNIYVTYPTWTEGQYTSIYRVSIDGGTLTFQAKGSVPGNVLNQYSMDEFNGYFRLATTNWKDTTENSVYVLDKNLTTVGTLDLTNAEIRETIQSARFIGNKAYIVTFEQKDPFFVLDMSNPTAPRVAGKLEIPGYSSYLHPYDENHIIGIGMENSTLKLSLFDVTNVNAPTEIAKYIVKGDYTYSEALNEPKAFLFDKAKDGLLVIPVAITQYGAVETGKDVAISPTQGGYWQGAQVFKLTLEKGFELRGGITHQGTTTSQEYWYGDYNLNVNRSLYIGNTLYTLSNSMVKLNSLTDLKQIAEVKLS